MKTEVNKGDFCVVAPEAEGGVGQIWRPVEVS